MSALQLITIDELTGELSGLHFRGKGIDLTKMGAAQVNRATEVLWDQEKQLWFCEFRQGRRNGMRIGREMLAFALNTSGTDPADIHCETIAGDELVYFTEYDHAVAVEVLVIQAYAIAGKPLM